MLSTGAALVIAVRSALASHRCSARVPGRALGTVSAG
jgi:hypothetical protein